MNKKLSILLGSLLFLLSCTKATKVSVYEHFWAPSTFTPNGDFFNETYNPMPRDSVYFSDYHILIFDDQMNILFESRDVNASWDPNGMGQNIPTGFYEYQIEYTCSVDSLNYNDYITTSKVNLIR